MVCEAMAQLVARRIPASILKYIFLLYNTYASLV